VDRDEADEALMLAYRAGDVGAFERLVARYEKPIWNFLRRSVRDPATAEDLLQEVFLRLIKSAGEPKAEWKGAAKLSTWLYTIARNLCVDHARRAVHRDARSLDGDGAPGAESELPMSLHERIPAPGAAADALIADREIAARIDGAIAALPDDQREVFLMREAMEMSFAEIAVAVGASEPTVKSRMRYALEKLRVGLAELAEGAAGVAESTRSG
jgi:RNA polymerase sigma-70 factor (ECF subfamily)